MLTLNNLAPNEGARRQRKRVGRGPGSGSGKTSARGHKGARARTGYSLRPGFEGGQMPLHRRLPKRGFKSLLKQHCTIISLEQLNNFDAGTVVDYDILISSGLVKVPGYVKILANGDIEKSLTVKIANISQGAKEKIIAAGGKIED